MALSELEEQCFAMLGNEALDEDDRVDRVEELVRQRYPSMASKQLQKVAMDIMWKHKDPKRQARPSVHIVKVSEVQTKIDIPDLERRLQLERQFVQLDALNQTSRTSKQGQMEAPSLPQTTDHTSTAEEKQYHDLLNRTNELKRELYGDKERPLAMANSSPIEHISSFFNGSVPKTRINQALKSMGYSVLDAVQLIISQLKQDQDTPVPQETAPYVPSPYSSYAPVVHSGYRESQPFFDPGKKNKAICVFMLKHGKCLLSDCQFSHDIKQRVCAYWLNGRCAAGDSCPFKHSLDDLSEYNEPEEGFYPIHQQSFEDQFPTLKSEEQFPPLQSSSPASTANSSTTLKSKKFNAASASSFSPSSFTPPPVVNITPKSSAISIVKPLKKPKLIPWEAKENEHLRNYTIYRNSATKFENQRKKYAQISTDAWRSNDGARSKQMSDKANKFEQKTFDALKEADDELYNYSESTNDEVWFEFHGLEFNEAVEQLNSSLKEVKAKTKNQSKVAYLVVPAMAYDHAVYKKTTKPISLWLDHEGYRWQLYGCGNGHYGSVIAIDPWSK